MHEPQAVARVDEVDDPRRAAQQIAGQRLADVLVADADLVQERRGVQGQPVRDQLVLPALDVQREADFPSGQEPFEVVQDALHPSAVLDGQPIPQVAQVSLPEVVLVVLALAGAALQVLVKVAAAVFGKRGQGRPQRLRR